MSTEHHLREAMRCLDDAVDLEDSRLLKAAIRETRRNVELVLADVLRRDNRPGLPLCSACEGSGVAPGAAYGEPCLMCQGEGVKRVGA